MFLKVHDRKPETNQKDQFRLKALTRKLEELEAELTSPPKEYTKAAHAH